MHVVCVNVKAEDRLMDCESERRRLSASKETLQRELSKAQLEVRSTTSQNWSSGHYEGPTIGLEVDAAHTKHIFPSSPLQVRERARAHGPIDMYLICLQPRVPVWLAGGGAVV